jgi:glycosyltransferase involved in cell wall biosynthesis
MARPLVSVVIPTFNCAKYLSESIDSAVSQTFAEKEVIVVDDGSTDNTKEALEPFKDRIVYIYQDNSGASSARNRGVAQSRGKYIAFLDADDIWLPGKLQKQVDFFERQPGSVKLTYTDWKYFFEPPDWHPQRILKISAYQGKVARQLFCHDFIYTPTVMIEREFLTSLGPFDRGLTIAEDYDMWLRASASCDFRFLPEVLAAVRMRPESLIQVAARETRQRTWIAVREKFLRGNPHLLNSFPLRLWRMRGIRAKALAVNLYTFTNSGMSSKDLRSLIRYFVLGKLGRLRPASGGQTR